jgi:hypothetical protein
VLQRIANKIKSFFNSIENIDWVKLWWVVGVIFTFWTGMATVLPEKVYKPVAVTVAAIQSAFLFAARGGKYVKDRNVLPPQDGKP